MLRFLRVLAALTFAAALWGEVRIFPLKDVHPGLRGVGKTVFSGDRIQEFQVEILGVLENVGPKQSVILARLSGGPLDSAGVMQGMSGSPVYIDGRLLGAVAMAFPFSKEPVAGIRPIAEMLEGAPPPVRHRAAGSALPYRSLAPAASYQLGDTRLADIATPVSFGGFTRTTLEHFAGELRSLGFEPRQGMSSGGGPTRFGNPALLQPGAMISVQLLAGDLNAGADGTITHVDGKRVYAFGHRFLAAGGTDLPFARAEVLTILPNLSSSFKISASREWMGSIVEDRNACIAGELGRRANMVPLSVSVGHSSGSKPSDYRMEVVSDRFLTPFLLQMAVYSAIDATERSIGQSTFSLRGRIEFQGVADAVRLDNMYAGDFAVPAQAAIGAAVPLAYAMQSGFDELQVKNIALTLDSWDDKRQFQIDQVWTSQPAIRPGESIELSVLLAGQKGAESTHKITWRAPIGITPGPVFFTVADGSTTNITEYQQFLTSAPKSAAQVVGFLNGLHGNTRAYVRVWRTEPAYQVQGEDFPSPPASLSMILAKSQPGVIAAPLARTSKIAEMQIDAGAQVITGSKTIQIEIKE